MLIAFILIGYLIGALLTKVYYRLYRYDHIMPEEPYLVGAFWPIYWLCRGVMKLLKWVSRPFVLASEYLENKVEQAHKARVETKVRITSRDDEELQEAEEEIEDYLNREESFRL